MKAIAMTKTSSLQCHIMSAKTTTIKLVRSEDFSPHKNPRTSVLTTCLITAILLDVISLL
jgi:hypothetical protein